MIAFYTYLHIRADDGQVFYVGKGTRERATRMSGRSLHWKRVVAKHGLRVGIVACWSTEREAFDHECLLIAKYRREGAPLCNQTDGGDGTSGHAKSPEVRAKIRARHVGKQIPEDVRAKIGAANKGKVRSPEFRAKISAALRLRKRTAETGERISAALTGKTLSADVRAKISATLSGRRLSSEERARRLPLQHSAEIRAKRSAAMKGRPWSAARRAAQIAKSGGAPF